MAGGSAKRRAHGAEHKKDAGGVILFLVSKSDIGSEFLEESPDVGEVFYDFGGDLSYLIGIILQSERPPSNIASEKMRNRNSF